MNAISHLRAVLVAVPVAILAACGGGGTEVADASNRCTLIEGTTPTTVVNPAGCAVVDRDVTGCAADRAAAGLSGVWLGFSCRVTLTATTTAVEARSDGRPSHVSNYFDAADPCHEAYAGANQNPNEIAAQAYVIGFPREPVVLLSTMLGGVVGLAVDGVPIYGAFAAPGMDIYTEAATFDRCGAHPDMNGRYHYHGEPYSISYDDRRLIGVMRDGYPIYGRYDADGGVPTLDAQGGHVAATAEDPTPGYHYHLNLQTSTTPGTVGEAQWFLTTGAYHGAPGTCAGC